MIIIILLLYFDLAANYNSLKEVERRFVSKGSISTDDESARLCLPTQFFINNNVDVEDLGTKPKRHKGLNGGASVAPRNFDFEERYLYL